MTEHTGTTEGVPGTLKQRLRDTAVGAILDAAEAVMAEKGYEQATMQEIATAAGCAAGTLYLYFKNKDELFQAVVLRHWRALAADMIAAEPDRDDPLAKLKSHTATFLDYFHAHRRFFDLFFSCMPPRKLQALMRLGEPFRTEQQAFERGEMELLRQAQKRGQVRKDIALEVLVEFIDATALTVVDLFATGRGPRRKEDQAELIWSLTLGGIGTGGHK